MTLRFFRNIDWPRWPSEELKFEFGYAIAFQYYYAKAINLAGVNPFSIAVCTLHLRLIFGQEYSILTLGAIVNGIIIANRSTVRNLISKRRILLLILVMGNRLQRLVVAW